MARARERRSAIDAWLDAYAAMSPEDRQFAEAALRGAKRMLDRQGPALRALSAATDAMAEDLGERNAAAREGL